MSHLFFLLSIALFFLSIPALAQSGGDYEAHVAWCQSIGGTHNYNPSNPVCTPGTAPVNQTPQQQNYYAPPQPDYQAQERARERVQKEKERRQQEEALRAAEEAARQAEFLKERDEAVSGLKGLGETSGGLKGLSDTVAATPQLKTLDDSCPPSQDANVVDLCFRDGKKESAKPIAKNKEEARIIKQMNDFAKRQGWKADELSRLDTALNTLSANSAESPKIVREVWHDILNRDNTALAQQAAAGTGPGFPGAGQQTSYEDCAVFALANAVGVPYSVVATQASELLSQAEWRKKDERKNPEKVFKNGGLNGGEVIILAESLGQAEVIKRTDFAKTLEGGRPVMINVVPQGGKGAHQVVLTKVFYNEDGAWYEMMDSNQGALRRLYLDSGDLALILKEDGIAFRPEAGTTPKLFQ